MQSEVDEIDGDREYNHIGYGHYETNDENNAWGMYSLIASFFVVTLAAFAHNFGFQAFIISLSFGLGLVFFKLVIIEEGLALNMYHRISMPDLVLGVILLIVSLAFYMIDVYVAYAFTHTMWHVLSFLGIYFMAIGLTRNVIGWYSPLHFCHKRCMKCCLNEEYGD